MKNTLIVILIIVVIALLVFILYDKNQDKKLQQKIKEAQELIASLELETHQLNTQLQLLDKINADYKQKYSELEKQKEAVNAALKESDARLKEIEAQVVAMPACDLVLNIQDIIGDTGVFQTEAGMIFTYSASQATASRLFQWREFSLVKIPKLEEKVKIQEDQITNLTFQISTWEGKEKIWKKENAIWLQEKATLNGLVLDYEKQLSKQKKRSKWSSALIFLAGIVGGMLVGGK
jgi:DNA repair exonuclease SbcCD ATPase subunit